MSLFWNPSQELSSPSTMEENFVMWTIRWDNYLRHVYLFKHWQTLQERQEHSVLICCPRVLVNYMYSLLSNYFSAITFMQNLCLGVFLGTGPAWMLYTLHSQQWMVGRCIRAFNTSSPSNKFLGWEISSLKPRWEHDPNCSRPSSAKF